MTGGKARSIRYAWPKGLVAIQWVQVVKMSRSDLRPEAGRRTARTATAATSPSARTTRSAGRTAVAPGAIRGAVRPSVVAVGWLA
jgi:hypothetical protein